MTGRRSLRNIKNTRQVKRTGAPQRSNLSSNPPSNNSNGEGYSPKKAINKGENTPMQLYRVVLIGKPNVGKSSLLNALTGSQSSIITRQSGTTRDSVNRVMVRGNEAVMLSDLPGWDEEMVEGVKVSDAKAFERARDKNIIVPVVFSSVQKEIEMSDIIVSVSDIGDVTPEDKMIIDWLKRYLGYGRGGGNENKKTSRENQESRENTVKPIIYCANKCDRNEEESAIGDVYETGAQEVIMVSSKMKRGLDALTAEIFRKSRELKERGVMPVNPHVFYLNCDYKLAIVGKPNAGKSSLFNALLHKERAVVSEVSGTTRDLVEDYVTMGKHVVKLIDTGGLRRRSREKSLPESYSVEKAIHAINQSDVMILVIDAVEGLSSQDKKIAALALSKKKSLVIAINKWDKIDEKWDDYYADLLLTFPPIREFPIIPISCANRKNLVKLLKMADGLYHDRSRKISNEELTRSLKSAVDMKDMAGGGGVRVRYAMQVQNHPPVFYIYVTNLNQVKGNFRKYLYNHLETLYRLQGTPLTLRFFDHHKKIRNKK